MSSRAVCAPHRRYPNWRRSTSAQIILTKLIFATLPRWKLVLMVCHDIAVKQTTSIHPPRSSLPHCQLACLYSQTAGSRTGTSAVATLHTVAIRSDGAREEKEEAEASPTRPQTIKRPDCPHRLPLLLLTIPRDALEPRPPPIPNKNKLPTWASRQR